MTWKIDYHGRTLEDALKDAEGIIDSARLQGNAVEVEIITGRGEIRQELMDLFENHSLKPTYKLGNDRVILVTVE